MTSTFLTATGQRIQVTAVHPLGVVCIEKSNIGDYGAVVGIHIPVELAGAMAQALTACAGKIATGPCAGHLSPEAIAAAVRFAEGLPAVVAG